MYMYIQYMHVVHVHCVHAMCVHILCVYMCMYIQCIYIVYILCVFTLTQRIAADWKVRRADGETGRVSDLSLASPRASLEDDPPAIHEQCGNQGNETLDPEPVHETNKRVKTHFQNLYTCTCTCTCN